MDITNALNGAPNKKEKIEKLAGTARIAELLLECRDHEGVKMLIGWLESRVNWVNLRLSENRRWEGEGNARKSFRLTDIERAEMDAARTECISIIELFPDAEKKLDSIQKKLKSYERE